MTLPHNLKVRGKVRSRRQLWSQPKQGRSLGAEPAWSSCSVRELSLLFQIIKFSMCWSVTSSKKKKKGHIMFDSCGFKMEVLFFVKFGAASWPEDEKKCNLMCV
jgi:hypothetical protein